MRHDGSRRYTICVDFDGVLHSYTSGWQGAHVIPDPPVDGAISWLADMARAFDVVILTTRADQPGANDAIERWLEDHGYTGPLPTITSHKGPALVYIDDRAWRFEGRFPDVGEIHAARPWNKREEASG